MEFPTPEELNKKIADQDNETFKACIQEIESYMISNYMPGRNLTGSLKKRISERVQQRIISTLRSKKWDIVFKDNGYNRYSEEPLISYEIGPVKPAAPYSDQRESNTGWQRD